MGWQAISQSKEQAIAFSKNILLAGHIMDPTLLGKKMIQVLDKNGVPLIAGQSVLVHQDEGIRQGVVIEPFIDSPTALESGHWVDIKIENDGIESMMSYILEVKKLS